VSDVKALREPGFDRILDRVAGRRLHSYVELGVQCLELVSHLLFGLAADLRAGALAIKTGTLRDLADLPVPGPVEVDPYIALGAYWWCAPVGATVNLWLLGEPYSRNLFC
jgi:hypothetical protein